MMVTARLRARMVAVAVVGALTALAAWSVPVQSAHADSFSCPYGALCIHGYKVNMDLSHSYYWKTYWYCQNWSPGSNFTPTWYVNNQTTGTVAKFTYYNGNVVKTGAAYAQGSISQGYNIEWIRPC